MSVSSVVSPTTELSNTVQGQVQVAMLKKAIDLEASQAAQLIQALPQPPKAEPGQPGAVVNTYV